MKRFIITLLVAVFILFIITNCAEFIDLFIGGPGNVYKVDYREEFLQEDSWDLWPSYMPTRMKVVSSHIIYSTFDEKNSGGHRLRSYNYMDDGYEEGTKSIEHDTRWTADDSYVYVLSTTGYPAELWRYSLSLNSSPDVVVLSNRGGAGNIAVDDNRIYVFDNTDGICIYDKTSYPYQFITNHLPSPGVSWVDDLVVSGDYVYLFQGEGPFYKYHRPANSGSSDNRNESLEVCITDHDVCGTLYNDLDLMGYFPYDDNTYYRIYEGYNGDHIHRDYRWVGDQVSTSDDLKVGLQIIINEDMLKDDDGPDLDDDMSLTLFSSYRPPASEKIYLGYTRSTDTGYRLSIVSFNRNTLP